MIVPMILSQWRHDLGVINNESRIKEIDLQEMSSQLIYQPLNSPWGRTQHIVFASLLIQHLPHLLTGIISRESDAKFVFQPPHHSHPFEGGSEVDGEFLVLCGVDFEQVASIQF